MELGILSIDAEVCKTFGTVVTEIAQVGHPFQKLGVTRHHSAAFDGVIELGRMKTAGADIAVLKHRSPFILHAKGMCAIVNNFKVSSFGDLVYHFHLTRSSVYVRRE